MADPDTETLGAAFSDLSRDQLAVLTREWLLHGHLQDRVGIPLLYQYGVDREGAEQVAIDEWAGASPLYSIRMQETLGFRGSTVDVILKNLQLDIGSPPQFMDFVLRYVDPDHAEFWLAHCGALMDVEPMGEDWVHGMCHTIEDPTFDATAAATNPHAIVRPIHRPPRTPSDRMPHCHWTITVDPAAPPAQAHPNLARVEDSLVAQIPIATVPRPDPAGGSTNGRIGYADEFDPDLRFEHFTRETLLAILREVAIQSQLLMRSYLLSVHERVGPDAAAEIGPRVLVGVAPVTAGRLTKALDLDGGTVGAIATVLALHPSFQPPGYIDLVVEPIDETRLRFALAPSAIFDEPDHLTWLAGITDPGSRAVDAIVRGVDPRAVATPVDARTGELLAYEITIDDATDPRLEEPETALARFSGAATFQFR